MARCYRATFRCHYDDGTLAYPSLHYLTDVPTAGDEPDPDDVADGIWSTVGAQFLGACPNSMTLTTLVVTEQVIAPAIGVQGSKTLNATGYRDPVNRDLPLGVVPLVNLHTGVVSRSARGWLFMPGPSDAGDLTNGTWDTAITTALDAFAAVLDNSFDLGSVFPTHVNPVVYSRTRHVRGTDPHTFRVTSASVNENPHYLRSRDTSP